MDKPKNIKDKEAIIYIEWLEEKIFKYESSPYVNSYLSLLFQIDCWNDQLIKNPIDLWADKDEKQFERAHKFFTEQKPYFEQLEYLRKLMIPSQQKELDEKIKMNNLGSAEKVALKHLKNGTGSSL